MDSSSDHLQWSILTHDQSLLKNDPSLISHYEHYFNGSFDEVLNSTLSNNILSIADIDLKTISPGEYQQIIKGRISSFETNSENAFQLFQLAASCLNAFVQVCWTGPPLKFSSKTFLPAEIDYEQLRKETTNHLRVDGEEIFQQCPEILLLAFAKWICDELASTYSSILPSLLWLDLRITFILQRIHDEKCFSLFEKLKQSITQLDLSLNSLDQAKFPEKRLLLESFLLETSSIYIYYAQDKIAFDWLQKYLGVSEFRFNLTGALGKRTKFQTKEVSQLILTASSREDSKILSAKSNGTLPPSLPLNDDTLLENIQLNGSTELRSPENFSATDPNLSVNNNLRAIDQCFILALCNHMKSKNPSDALTKEEVLAYVQRVLENPNNWSVHSMALLMRSRLQKDKSRTVERSVLQIQALVDQIPCLDSPNLERLKYFYSLLLPAKWQLEKELAQSFLSLGVVKSALEIFERLEMWNEIIECYQLLDQSDKAIHLVKEQLQKNPISPNLVCLLGVLQDDPSRFLEAWHLSNQRFSKAMRLLGNHQFKQKKFHEAIESYELALQLNPLFENTWFNKGCAAMVTNQFSIAIESFKHSILIEPDHFEALNNIASIYFNEKQFHQAQHYYRLALKLNRDNWKLWMNYVLINLHINDWNNLLYCFQQILLLHQQKRSISQDLAHPIDWSLLKNFLYKFLLEFDQIKDKLSQSIDSPLTDLTTSMDICPENDPVDELDFSQLDEDQSDQGTKMTQEPSVDELKAKYASLSGTLKNIRSFLKNLANYVTDYQQYQLLLELSMYDDDQEQIQYFIKFYRAFFASKFNLTIDQIHEFFLFSNQFLKYLLERISNSDNEDLSVEPFKSLKKLLSLEKSIIHKTRNHSNDTDLNEFQSKISRLREQLDSTDQ